ncbi:hypothetical protein EIM92_11810 [Paenibacillus lentus]|uniref:Uncharacterized protein n=1 Tax=Paenibacillus lentus TaxID=1338368 RepID=A0A3S8RV74_9BACL|nr:hypothetical protein EIM92_11810 [Paenibacillus lentus]
MVNMTIGKLLSIGGSAASTGRGIWRSGYFCNMDDLPNITSFDPANNMWQSMNIHDNLQFNMTHM